MTDLIQLRASLATGEHQFADTLAFVAEHYDYQQTAFDNGGLASAAIEGMCSTAAPIVAVMDADHQHDPALLPGMLEAVESGDYDLAYASRFWEGASTGAGRVADGCT